MFNIFFPFDIAENKDCFTCTLIMRQRSQIGRNLFAFGLLDAADNDFCAGFNKLISAAFADAATASRDDYDFVGVSHLPPSITKVLSCDTVEYNPTVLKKIDD